MTTKDCQPHHPLCPQRLPAWKHFTAKRTNTILFSLFTQFFSRSSLPTIFQNEIGECGLVCLTMIAKYHGLECEVATLRRRFGVNIRGTTLTDIMDWSQNLGFQVRSVRVELNQLHYLKLPSILHWDLKHFVVLQSAHPKHIVIHDPVGGVRRVSFQECGAHLTGYALELWPDPAITQPQFKAEESLKISNLVGRTEGLLRAIGHILWFGLAIQVLGLAAPFFLRFVVDDIISSSSNQLLLKATLGFLGVAIVTSLVHEARTRAVLNLGATLDFELASRTFRKLLSLPLSYFYSRQQGAILSRFNVLSTIRRLVSTDFVEAIVDGVMILVSICAMIWLSPMLTLISFISISLYAALRGATLPRLKEAQADENACRAKEKTVMYGTIKAIQPIKLFSREKQRESDWLNRYIESINANVRVERIRNLNRSTARALLGIEYGVLIWTGALLVMGDKISLGSFYAFLAFRTQFAAQFQLFIDRLVDFQILEVHLQFLSDIFLEDSEEQESRPFNKLRGALSCENLGFSYDKKSETRIHGLDIDILPGQFVRIVGSSGSGKTTLLRLMLGIVKPTTGKIYVDNIELVEFGVTNFKHQVSTVMQDDQLLNGSIRDNISFFDPSPNQERLEWCCEIAQIRTDIDSMTMGFETLIGDMGIGVSGGQAQRLMLARALYPNPNILFLDEATSHLDIETEQLVLTTLRELPMTIIMVSHRESSALAADIVIDLDQIKFATEQ